MLAGDGDSTTNGVGPRTALAGDHSQVAEALGRLLTGMININFNCFYFLNMHSSFFFFEIIIIIIIL